MRFHAPIVTMFFHVPLGNEVFAAVGTFKRLYSRMLSHVHLQITSSVVFFVAPWHITDEFKLIKMIFNMISKNPLLAERTITHCTVILSFVRLVMSRHMIIQML